MGLNAVDLRRVVERQTLRIQRPGAAIRELPLDPEGRAQFTGLYPGRYDVFLGPDRVAVVEVAPGAMLDVEFEVPSHLRPEMGHGLDVISADVILARPILFASGSDQLDDAAEEVLLEMLPILRGRSEGVCLVGHADARETPEYNLELGMRRARSVAARLVRWGIPSGRLHPSSVGAEHPLSADDSTNRRVELSLGGPCLNPGF